MTLALKGLEAAQDISPGLTERRRRAHHASRGTVPSAGQAGWGSIPLVFRGSSMKNRPVLGLLNTHTC